jgi:hypothetical protein
MPLMKEIWTPLKWIGIRYFKDEKGIYYKKVGNRHRKKIRPFWKMKRVILGIPLLILLGLGWMGYRIGMNMASEKVMNEISSQISKKDIDTLLQDKSVQALIQKELGPEEAKKLLGKPLQDNPLNTESQNSATTNKNSDASKGKSSSVTQKEKGQPINGGQKASGNKEENQSTNHKQLTFHSREEAMKFLLSKFSMSELMAFAKKSEGGLTPEEKAEIKEAITKRLTPEEYNALKVYAFIELSKKKGQ